jgi:hypothetical protein
MSFCLPSQRNRAVVSHQLHHKNAQNGVLCDVPSTQAVPNYFKMSCRGVSRHASECNFICASKRNAALPAPIPTKPTNAEQRYVQLSYTEFHPNNPRNVGSTGRNAFTPFSQV